MERHGEKYKDDLALFCVKMMEMALFLVIFQFHEA